MVQELVPGVPECFERRLPGEVVKVCVNVPPLQEGPFAQDGLYAQIQGNVKDLQLALRPDPLQKAEVVFDVLDDVENQHEIEDAIVLLRHVRESELKSFVRATLAHLQGLWRDVATPEPARWVHLLLQESDDFPCAAANVADGLRSQTVSLHHFQDLLDLER